MGRQTPQERPQERSLDPVVLYTHEKQQGASSYLCVMELLTGNSLGRKKGLQSSPSDIRLSSLPKKG
jgi:hypothetical protein